MQLSELSSCNSIPNTQLRELESARSMQATEPYGMLPSTSSTNTRKGSNALAKVQLENMECTPAKGCKFNIENSQLTPRGRNRRRRMDRLLPERARETSLRRSRLRGSVNFGTFYVPDSHPTPSASSSVLGFFFLVLFWSVSLPSSEALLRAVCIACIMHA